MSGDTAMPMREADLPGYVRALGLAGGDELLEVEPAGDGNINWVRRVRAPHAGRSWVVKQARHALEKFPQYRASTERIVFEHRWLEIARALDGDRVCPEVVAFDAARRALVLEDLGGAERLDAALARGADVEPALRRIARLLGAVHAATAPRAPELAADFRNDEMRRLHGDHVFHLPLRTNEFPLPAALRAAAARVWADAELVAIADRAYARYLEPRGALVHADVQAGNVLLAPRGPVLLDAEIAHVGDPAFDVGTLVAHLILAAVGRGVPRAAAPPARAIWAAYDACGDGSVRFADAARYAAIEVLRRTIGAARVAAIADPAAGLAALELAVSLLRRPPETSDDLARALAAAPVRKG